ncbi:MAG: hypothetical protein ACTHJP_11645 [Rhodanobacteraceae bacterium]
MRFSPATDRHIIEYYDKISVVEKIANPWSGPARRALAALARRCSTTLSTAIVDKKIFSDTSPVYRPFLHAVTTSRDKS